MTNRMPTRSVFPLHGVRAHAQTGRAQQRAQPDHPRGRGRARPLGRSLALGLALALALALALGGCSSAKPAAPAAGSAPSGAAGAPGAAGGSQAGGAQATGAGQVVDESFSIRLDEDLYQLEEAISLIAGSLNKVADRTPTLAINSFYFGKDVNADFRRKAEVVILDKIFQANPRVRLVQCQECQKLETKIAAGVLKLRKGIPTQEARRALAEKLGVDGFIDIGMFTSDGQLTVYLKVVEAQSGAIILVDELAGRRASKRRALTFGFGELNFPISGVDHKALELSVQESVKLTGRFSFAVDLLLFVGNNANNPSATVTLNSGLLLSPTFGFDIVQVPSSTSRVVGFIGIGKLIAPQLDYANFARAGLEVIVGDQLSVLFAFNSFQDANLDNGTDTLSGAGYEIRFGYRW